MKRMLEVKGIISSTSSGQKIGDVRVRVDLMALALHVGALAIEARGSRREFLGGSVVVEAFNVQPWVDPQIPSTPAPVEPAPAQDFLSQALNEGDGVYRP